MFLFNLLFVSLSIANPLRPTGSYWRWFWPFFILGSMHCPSLSHSMFFICDYFANLWCTHGSFELEFLVLLQSTVFLLFILVICRRFVRLHWFLAVTLRQLLLDPINHAESLVFVWTTRQILSIFYNGRVFPGIQAISVFPSWLKMHRAFLACFWFCRLGLNSVFTDTSGLLFCFFQLDLMPGLTHVADANISVFHQPLAIIQVWQIFPFSRPPIKYIQIRLGSCDFSCSRQFNVVCKHDMGSSDWPLTPLTAETELVLI